MLRYHVSRESVFGRELMLLKNWKTDTKIMNMCISFLLRFPHLVEKESLLGGRGPLSDSPGATPLLPVAVAPDESGPSKSVSRPAALALLRAFDRSPTLLS